MKSIKLNVLFYMGICVLNIIFFILIGIYVVCVLDWIDYGYFNFVDIILLFFLFFVIYGVYNYGLWVISNVKDNKKDLNRIFFSFFYLCIVCMILIIVVYIFVYFFFFIDNLIVKKVYFVMGI